MTNNDPSPDAADADATAAMATAMAAGTPRHSSADHEGAASIRVFTTGASLMNGTRHKIGAYAAWIGDRHPGNVARWTRDGHITNQTMELAGALAGLEAIDVADADHATLYTPSYYVASCITRWLPRWLKTGWITKQKRPVKNGDTIKRMSALLVRHHVRIVRVPAPQTGESGGAAEQHEEDREGEGEGEDGRAAVVGHTAIAIPTDAVEAAAIRHGIDMATKIMLSAANDGMRSGCTIRHYPLRAPAFPFSGGG